MYIEWSDGWCSSGCSCWADSWLSASCGGIVASRMTHMCPAHGDGLSGRNDSVGIGYYIESLYTTRAKFLPTAPPLRIESQLGAPTQGGAVSLTPSFSRS